jgi:hypothetical protein
MWSSSARPAFASSRPGDGQPRGEGFSGPQGPGVRCRGPRPSPPRQRLPYGHWTGAVKPPSPPVSGELPTVAGIRPLIGPPLAAPAGVEST